MAESKLKLISVTQRPVGDGIQSGVARRLNFSMVQLL